ncbi:hypothetical protein [Verrucomicrobium spinosum]|uniref:hypothetical protein n=1 Tax=Verrucomicrobium spinosum TaxID=2736 RepID=UPI000A6EA7F6|nr:hypothetical protein [Verrucomicrobium spinosum]
MISSFPSASVRFASLLALATLSWPSQGNAAPKKEEVVDPNAPVSFYKQIRPIFQGQCYGCHQPPRPRATTS